MAATKVKFTAITEKAYKVASNVAQGRKDQGIPSSISAVVSESVIRTFSDQKG